MVTGALRPWAAAGRAPIPLVDAHLCAVAAVEGFNRRVHIAYSAASILRTRKVFAANAAGHAGPYKVDATHFGARRRLTEVG